MCDSDRKSAIKHTYKFFFISAHVIKIYFQLWVEMEVKRIESSAFLCMGHNRSDIAKRHNDCLQSCRETEEWEKP